VLLPSGDDCEDSIIPDAVILSVFQFCLNPWFFPFYYCIKTNWLFQSFSKPNSLRFPWVNLRGIRLCRCVKVISNGVCTFLRDITWGYFARRLPVFPRPLLWNLPWEASKMDIFATPEFPDRIKSYMEIISSKVLRSSSFEHISCLSDRKEVW